MYIYTYINERIERWPLSVVANRSGQLGRSKARQRSEEDHSLEADSFGIDGKDTEEVGLGSHSMGHSSRLQSRFFPFFFWRVGKRGEEKTRSQRAGSRVLTENALECYGCERRRRSIETGMEGRHREHAKVIFQCRFDDGTEFRTAEADRERNRTEASVRGGKFQKGKKLLFCKAEAWKFYVDF